MLFCILLSSLTMDNFEWLTFFDNNTELNTLCSSHDNNDLFDHFFSSYSKSFNNNFAETNSLLSEPFNVNLLSSFNHSEPLELLEFSKPPSEPPSEPSSALPFVLPVEPPSEPSFELILDDNFTDIEDIDNSLSLESSFNDNTYQYNLVKG